MALDVDIAVIGGGINGCALARDAAGRGYRVYLCEMSDLASGSSSNTSKLTYGGLPHLEERSFRRMAEALEERELLCFAAPHVVRPIRFVMPHNSELRSAWYLRFGVFIYNLLGRRKTLNCARAIKLDNSPVGSSLKRGEYPLGIQYTECWMDDARFVVTLALDAAEHGATIETRTKAVFMEPSNDGWRLTVFGTNFGETKQIKAKVIVNSAGPLARDITFALGSTAPARARALRTIYIVINKKYEHDCAFALQQPEQSFVFVVPYEDDFTMIGMSEEIYWGDESPETVTTGDVQYICDVTNTYFAKKVNPPDVIMAFAGVRPLTSGGTGDDKSPTREFTVALLPGAPSLTIHGGDITTHRALSENALTAIASFLPPVSGKPIGWTRTAKLPGGDFPFGGLPAQTAALISEFPWLESTEASRLSRAYGTRAGKVLNFARSREQLGETFGAGLSQVEIEYLMDREWAQCADDVVWRRSKLGLRMTAEELNAIDGFMSKRLNS